MSFFSKKKKIVTHDGSFHADDLFAAAVLSIVENNNIKIIRTRDPEIIKKADIVFDVGGIYDEFNNRFDHHQKVGAGVRENGIPYASFGLVWKKFGEQICGNREVANRIENKIVLPIDASDNGKDFIKPLISDIFPYSAESIFLAEVPTWKEDDFDIDKIFIKQVHKIILLLKREIKIAKDDIEGQKIIINTYKKSENKKIIILDLDLPRYLIQNTLCNFPEPIYIIYPSLKDKKNTGWKVEAIKKSSNTMESRKFFPESWRGIMEESGRLKEITGVKDALFCHASGFLLTVGSKEGAIKLAEKALLS